MGIRGEKMELIKVDVSEAKRAYRRLEESFPPEERRPFADFCRVWEDARFSLFFAREGGEEVGLISLWQFSDFVFVEHLAVYPEQRGGGYGGKIMRAVSAAHPALVLEIEPPTEGDKLRRWEFYRRLGFVMNDFPYFQPAYSAGGEKLEMRLLSLPMPLKNPQNVIAEIYRAVYGIEFKREA